MPQITISINSEKWANFKKRFLLVYPLRNNMTDDEWVRYKILQLLKGINSQGKRLEYSRAYKPGNDDDGIEVG